MLRRLKAVLLGLVLALALLAPYGVAQEAQPRSGGTLVVGVNTNPWSFDPNVVPGVVGAIGLYHIYDGLFNLSPSGEPVPGLALEMQSVAENHLRLPLREGVTFHNGEPFTAADVVYTFERVMAPDAQGILSSSFIQKISRVEAVDDYTVEIYLNEPWPEFERILANYGARIVNQRAVEEAGSGWGTTSAIGTGPFRFVEWIQDDRFVLERNPDYWRDGLPYLDRIEVKIIPDESVRAINLRNGDIDMDMYPALKDLQTLDAEEGITVSVGLGNETSVMWLNLLRPPFDDQRVRQALSLAIDRQSLVDTVFYGYAEPAGDLFPSHYVFHDPELDVDVDLERARELLAEAGYSAGNPLTFDLLVTNLPLYMDQAVLVQAQLAQVGVNVNIVTADQATVFDYVQGARGMTADDWQAALEDYAASGMTAFDFAWKRYHSNAPQNYMGYNKPGGPQNPEVDQLLQEASIETDNDQARTLLVEASRMINEDVPLIRLAFLKSVAAARDHVMNLELGEIGIITNFTEVWLEN